MIDTMYVMTPGTVIRQDGGLLVLEKEHEVMRQLPMATVGTIVLGRTVQISTQVMFSLVKQGSVIQFVDHKYNLIGTLGDEHTSLKKLLWQVKYFMDETFAHMAACYIVYRKVKAQQAILDQYHKTRDIPNYDSIRHTLQALANKIERTTTVDALRGIEGLSSRTYFSVWNEILSEPWTFPGRKRHPSTDPVNALLSYGYSFLEREVRACLLSTGLDIRIGVLHSTNDRKDSFVYDVMDLLRQEIIDRFILKVFNRQMINQSNFDISERGCFLAKDSHKAWIQTYEYYMTHAASRLAGQTPRKWIQQEVKYFLDFLNEIGGGYFCTNQEKVSKIA